MSRGRSAARLRIEPFSSISLFSPQTRGTASASWKDRVLTAELHRVVCVWVCLRLCQRIGAHRLAGCILDHLIHRLILCSFVVASSPWPSACSSVVIPFFSPSYFAIVRFRTPVVPPWFLLRVKNNPTPFWTRARSFCLLSHSTCLTVIIVGKQVPPDGS